MKGDTLETKKNEKSRTVPKKIKGDPIVSSGFVFYVFSSSVKSVHYAYILLSDKKTSHCFRQGIFPQGKSRRLKTVSQNLLVMRTPAKMTHQQPGLQ